MRPSKRAVIWAAVTVLVLAVAFLLQPDAKTEAGNKSEPPAPAYTAGQQTPAVEHTPPEEGAKTDSAPAVAPPQKPFENPEPVAEQEKETEQAKEPEKAEDPHPAQTPTTASSPSPQATEQTPQEQEKQIPPSPPDSQTLTCSLAIDCSTTLENMDKLAKGKESLIPSDGLLLNLTDVEFFEGESVFDVLLRELRNRNMHIEFSLSPLYGTAYIEGICNLYEFDCGELSGWIYSVNGDFSSLGCDKYTLSDKDSILWVYTCNKDDNAGRNK